MAVDVCGNEISVVRGIALTPMTISPSDNVPRANAQQPTPPPEGEAQPASHPPSPFAASPPVEEDQLTHPTAAPAPEDTSPSPPQAEPTPATGVQTTEAQPRAVPHPAQTLPEARASSPTALETSPPHLGGTSEATALAPRSAHPLFPNEQPPVPPRPAEAACKQTLAPPPPLPNSGDAVHPPRYWIFGVATILGLALFLLLTRFCSSRIRLTGCNHFPDSHPVVLPPLPLPETPPPTNEQAHTSRRTGVQRAYTECIHCTRCHGSCPERRCSEVGGFQTFHHPATNQH